MCVGGTLSRNLKILCSGHEMVIVNSNNTYVISTTSSDSSGSRTAINRVYNNYTLMRE